mmetsp:Transcript_84895/g.168525  ORF Transcript_84895/g.168525 Transcript_84895/m.168525 type:complete len:360 (-) Transcript_84895:408-1487(-)
MRGRARRQPSKCIFTAGLGRRATFAWKRTCHGLTTGPKYALCRKPGGSKAGGTHEFHHSCSTRHVPRHETSPHSTRWPRPAAQYPGECIAGEPANPDARSSEQVMDLHGRAGRLIYVLCTFIASGNGPTCGDTVPSDWTGANSYNHYKGGTTTHACGPVLRPTASGCHRGPPFLCTAACGNDDTTPFIPTTACSCASCAEALIHATTGKYFSATAIIHAAPGHGSHEPHGVASHGAQWMSDDDGTIADGTSTAPFLCSTSGCWYSTEQFLRSTSAAIAWICTPTWRRFSAHACSTRAVNNNPAYRAAASCPSAAPNATATAAAAAAAAIAAIAAPAAAAIWSGTTAQLDDGGNHAASRY